jgi:uncharacterized protein with HEPN domain
MAISDRDAVIIKKIIKYCEDIDRTNKIFGDSREALAGNSVYMNALAMCILQIGELTIHISTEFKSSFADIPWNDIRGMRNIAAHHYGDFSVKYLWDTIQGDIPDLRAFCKQRIVEYESQSVANGESAASE